MTMYNGILGTVGVHTCHLHGAGAEFQLQEAMAKTGNIHKYKIIWKTDQKYYTSIKYEVFA